MRKIPVLVIILAIGRIVSRSDQQKICDKQTSKSPKKKRELTTKIGEWPCMGLHKK